MDRDHCLHQAQIFLISFLYRSQFLGHGCYHIGPDRGIASFDDRRS
jgi:hypothetical protein